MDKKRMLLSCLCFYFIISKGYCLDGILVEGCPIFPGNNIWNASIESLPVDKNSDSFISSIGSSKSLHPDFGSGLWDGEPIGIPYNIVDSTQEKVEVYFKYNRESDNRKYPIPKNVLIEGGPKSRGDRHVIIINITECFLYEIFDAHPLSNGTWSAGSGAIFNLKSNRLRPRKWTSADAAGLPIFPGLVRYEEVLTGEIKHALRFTARTTRGEYIWPARHFASRLSGEFYPPMGQRFRLKKEFNIDDFSNEVKVILIALKKYGMILADNGSDWFVSGVPDERWNNDILVNELRKIKGRDFEAVDVTSLIMNSDSGQTNLDPDYIDENIDEGKYDEENKKNCFLSTMNENLPKD